MLGVSFSLLGGNQLYLYQIKFIFIAMDKNDLHYYVSYNFYRTEK